MSSFLDETLEEKESPWVLEDTGEGKGSLKEMAVLAAEGMVFGPEMGKDCLGRRWLLSDKGGGVKSGKHAPGIGDGD